MALIDEVTKTAVQFGLARDTARALAAQTVRSAARMVLTESKTDIKKMVDAMCVPGSITGQGLEILRDHEAFNPWRDASAAVFNRLRS